MSLDHLSLIFVNTATGLMLGLSLYLAIDVWPWLQRRWHWWLVLMLAVWSSALLLGSLHGAPLGLILRRFTNGAAALFVAIVLFMHERKECRRERK